MSWRFLVYLTSICLISIWGDRTAVAQDSLASKRLGEVVVTATRSERAIADLPVPMTIIQGQQIREMGSLRLNDVLAEQTGLAITSDHGTGVQLQGFNPDYTLILVDGEPLVGRTSGTLELSRIAVGNIKQIEIMKGPSSSLYGSEALAGVINIITSRPDGTNGSFNARYGTNNTSDFSATGNITRGKLGVYIFADRYATDGYDLSPTVEGKTVSPFSNYTFQSRLTYRLSDKTRITLSGRYFTESQTSTTDAGSIDVPVLLNGDGSVNEWNINPYVTHSFSEKLKATLRFYGSKYTTRSSLAYQSDGASYDETFFDQTFTRPELQLEYFVNTDNIVTVGGGRIWETVEATRYDHQMKYETNYAYAQYEWHPVSKLNILAGARFDDHSAYGSQLSPKLSVQYDLLRWIGLRASYGVGFKAPDFRQLYLNFTNSTVGYTVLGSQVLQEGMRQLQEQNQIREILMDPSTFGAIKAETSSAYNFGFRLTPVMRLVMNANFFRNDVKDLIDTRAVALKTNGQQVFSYYNLSRVFTQGLEVDASYSLAKSLTLSGGYQYLLAKDKAVVDALNAGEVYARDPETNATRRVRENEYGGLFNRSRHMGNLKLFYDDEANGWGANIRAIYRGRYGFSDANNNTILDTDSEYVDGYVTCNVSVSKTFNKMFHVQLGCDNVLDYKDERYIPTLPGRLLWASVGLTLSDRKKDQQ